MTIVADTHTHTSACDHAYSSIDENARAAKERGLKFIAMTEHSPSMPGGPSFIHFANLRAIPPVLHDVIILKGSEVNIMDSSGVLDLEDNVLDNLDLVIASLHTMNFIPATKKEHTEAWLSVVTNPLVDIMGHMGDGRYPFDEERVIKEVAKNGKVVEINSHSFVARPGSVENCPRIAKLCMQYGVKVVVSSDAHFYNRIGEFKYSTDLLEEIGFPEENILNADYNRFLDFAKEKAKGATLKYLQQL